MARLAPVEVKGDPPGSFGNARGRNPGCRISRLGGGGLYHRGSDRCQWRTFHALKDFSLGGIQDSRKWLEAGCDFFLFPLMGSPQTRRALHIIISSVPTFRKSLNFSPETWRITNKIRVRSLEEISRERWREIPYSSSESYNELGGVAKY